MSSNFYLYDPKKPHSRGAHVGKRFAKGYYCWDCKKPASALAGKKVTYHCFYCGATREEDKDFFNPALRELGFVTGAATSHGINGAMGFVWALGDNGLGVKTVKEARDLAAKTEKFVNEYEEALTQEDFQNALHECIDDEFSFEPFS